MGAGGQLVCFFVNFFLLVISAIGHGHDNTATPIMTFVWKDF